MSDDNSIVLIQDWPNPKYVGDRVVLGSVTIPVGCSFAPAPHIKWDGYDVETDRSGYATYTFWANAKPVVTNNPPRPAWLEPKTNAAPLPVFAPVSIWWCTVHEYDSAVHIACSADAEPGTCKMVELGYMKQVDS